MDQYDSSDGEYDNEYTFRSFQNLQIHGPDMSEIINGKLYLSCYVIANDREILDKYNIKKVISIGSNEDREAYVIHEGIEYRNITIYDSDHAIIYDYFDEMNKFINESAGAVLVHCWAGISRSTTIVAAYLMAERKIGVDDAIQFIRKKRRRIWPNFGFQMQLLQYQKRLQGL